MSISEQFYFRSCIVSDFMAKYLSFGSLYWNSFIFAHISWSLLSFCLRWCLAHVSHIGSGSSHVLQNWVASNCSPSVEQGLQINLKDAFLLKRQQSFNVIKLYSTLSCKTIFSFKKMFVFFGYLFFLFLFFYSENIRLRQNTTHL